MGVGAHLPADSRECRFSHHWLAPGNAIVAVCVSEVTKSYVSKRSVLVQQDAVWVDIRTGDNSQSICS